MLSHWRPALEGIACLLDDMDYLNCPIGVLRGCGSKPALLVALPSVGAAFPHSSVVLPSWVSFDVTRRMLRCWRAGLWGA